jgi:glycosyltransferase involved in cell wall biosynthesis
MSDGIKSSSISITVIMVVFNAVDTLERSVLSVINQSYKNIQFVVIDGGSTDGSVNILERYDHSIDVLVSESDRGVYDAMNKGVSYAKGEWIYFLGADDLLLPEIIGKIIPLLKDITNVYYGDVILSSTKLTYCGRMSKFKFMQQNICHQAIFYPTHLLRRFKYKVYYKILGDYYLNLSLLGRGIKFCYLNQVVAVFNTAGLSSGIDKNFSKVKMLVIKKNFSFIHFILKNIRNFLVRLIK